MIRHYQWIVDRNYFACDSVGLALSFYGFEIKAVTDGKVFYQKQISSIVEWNHWDDMQAEDLLEKYNNEISKWKKV